MKPSKFTPDQLKAKLLARTDIQESGCWMWTGGILKNDGFGQLRLTSTCAVLAHRLSYELHNKPIPKGKYLIHTCGHRLCINPDHLRIADKKDFSSGIIPRKPRALTEDQAKEIIRLRKSGMRLSHIAGQFNIPYCIVASVMHGKTWKHLREPSPKPRISMADAVRNAVGKAKPTTVMGLDPAFSSTDKTMIVSAEVMAEGIKFKEA